jgi:HPt (histidine-containing phosphotransfer) domain-containing protein
MIQDDPIEQNKKIVVYIDPELEELIPGFFENRRNDIKTIQEALIKGDYEKIKILGHCMKGSGGGYGFDGISRIGDLLEQAAEKQDSEEIQKGLNQLLTYLEKVEIVYKN